MRFYTIAPARLHVWYQLRGAEVQLVALVFPPLAGTLQYKYLSAPNIAPTTLVLRLTTLLACRPTYKEVVQTNRAAHTEASAINRSVSSDTKTCGDVARPVVAFAG